jgi:hypothetical protein
MRVLGRMVWVPLAFVLAAMLAAFVLITLGYERLTHAFAGKGQSADGLFELFDLFRQGAALASGLTLVPALALVIIGEVARIRSAIYYVIGGGLALAAVPVLAKGVAGTMAMPPAAVWQVFATAGFAGGWAYWMLAGRNS